MATLTEQMRSTGKEWREALSPEELMRDRSAGIHWRSLLLALAAPFGAALLGSIATRPFLSSWYRSLKKPPWNPPTWIFAPVWTVLYLSMGIASWLVWREGETGGWTRLAAPWRQSREERVRGALRLYGIHLLFNALWSVLFFGARRIGWALGEVVVLWAFVAATLMRFSRIRPLAGLLLVPYQVWVSFAAVLNWRIWQLNRER